MKRKVTSIIVATIIMFTSLAAHAQITQQLYYGSRGAEIVELQNKLNSLGYNAGPADGIYGYKTYLSVKSFQTNVGLNATGNLDFTTLNRLNKAYNKEPLILSNGMRNTKITELQTYLYALKYLGVSPTGYFGSLTQFAVCNFQRDNGLQITGKADSLLFKKIFQVVDSKFVPYTTYTPYTVLKGDTIWGIANKSEVSQNDLLKANNLTLSSSLVIGQTLQIPKINIPAKPYGNGYGEYHNWFSSAQYIFSTNREATVIDYFSGKSFRIKRTIGSGHADCETLTSQDTAIMKEIFGGKWSWEKRPIIIIVDGRRIAASMAGMPHSGLDAYPAGVNVANRSDGYGYGPNYDYIKGNEMDGHFDIHFPGSVRHKDWQTDPEHQLMINISSNR